MSPITQVDRNTHAAHTHCNAPKQRVWQKQQTLKKGEQENRYSAGERGSMRNAHTSSVSVTQQQQQQQQQQRQRWPHIGWMKATSSQQPVTTESTSNRQSPHQTLQNLASHQVPSMNC
jgi:uncharacterized protein YraI